MIIDHIGYAVKKIDKAIDELKILGFVFNDIINDYDRNIKICFGVNEGYCIELISPISKGIPSPIDGYLSKVGPIPYHFCYRTNNMETDIEELKKQGFRLILEPKFASAFSLGQDDNNRVCFLAGKNIGVFELVEEKTSLNKSGGGNLDCIY